MRGLCMWMTAALLSGKGCRGKGSKRKSKGADYRQKREIAAPFVRVSLLFPCSHRNGFQGVFVTVCAAGPSAENLVASAPFFMLFSPSYRLGDALPLSS